MLYTIDSAAPEVPGDLLTKLSRCRRVLLIEANDQRRWVGSRVVPEVHIPPIGLMYVASFARLNHPDAQIQILETSMDARSDEALTAKLLEFGPDMVGIRSISLFEDELRRVAGIVKRVLGIPVVAGGPSRPPGAVPF